MRINVLQSIKDYENKDILKKENEPFTARDAFANALASIKVDPKTREQEQLTSEVRNKIYQINLKLYTSNEPDFTVTELAFIKERAEIGYGNNPLVYGRIVEILEGAQNQEANPTN